MKTVKKCTKWISSILLIGLITACIEGSGRKSTDSIKVEASNAKEALAEYPLALISEFAVLFPEVRASEIFRRVDFYDDPSGIKFWGIEGQSPDEAVEIEAIFSPDLVLLGESRELLLDALPDDILVAFLKLYPDAEIAEMVSSLEEGEVAYAILFILDGEEKEVNLDETGAFESLESVLDQDEVPATILALIGVQRVDMEETEYEQVIHADESVSYVIEFENDAGESISFEISAGGKILQVEFEGPIQSD